MSNKYIDAHFALWKRMTDVPVWDRVPFVEEIEEYCMNLGEESPSMSSEERRFAWESIACMNVYYREITSKELTIALKPRG